MKNNEFYATSIRLPIILLDIVKKEAKIDKRSISKQIEYIIELYYKEKEEN